MSKQKIKIFKYVLFLVMLFVSLVGFVTNYPNVNVTKENNILFINKTDNFETVKESLYQKNIIEFETPFELVASLKHYPQNVKPGRYELHSWMGNLELINKLRAGLQNPCKISFRNVKNIEGLSKKLSNKLMVDSAQIMDILNNKENLESLGFNKQTIISMFIPNTYQVYWTVNPLSLIHRMKKEYDKFWNKKRLRSAKRIGLTPVQVATLASIVDQETLRDSENRRVAGVYMNRLKKRIKLCADPTVIFANNDFSIRRVLRRHLKFDSPYNTYKYYGLPPGPISIPSVSAIDAVLNYEKHSFIFFCAKSDFSGTHDFSITYAGHKKYARAYRAELTRRKIF